MHCVLGRVVEARFYAELWIVAWAATLAIMLGFIFLVAEMQAVTSGKVARSLDISAQDRWLQPLPIRPVWMQVRCASTGRLLESCPFREKVSYGIPAKARVWHEAVFRPRKGYKQFHAGVRKGFMASVVSLAAIYLLEATAFSSYAPRPLPDPTSRLLCS